jgi:ATP-dependent RNA helicase DeaD
MPRHGMTEGSVWFRAAIGRKKNAEARWLLPMICRRGGIDKHDIGAIRIMDTTTEFEISKAAAESFAAMIRRPDKEDNIRIEALAEAPQGQASQEKRSYPPRREAGPANRGDRPNDRSREDRGPKPHGKPGGGSGPGFAREPGYDKKKKYAHKPAYAGKAQHAGAADAKPAFGKKKKKNRGG